MCSAVNDAAGKPHLSAWIFLVWSIFLEINDGTKPSKLTFLNELFIHF